MSPRPRAAHIHLLGRIQRLQAVAVEASCVLRAQCVQVLQTQTIRLEDVVDTEIENADGLAQCMNELMLGVLYTELRRDVRQVTEALDRAQYEALSGRQKPMLSPAAAAATTAAAPIEPEDTTSAEEMVTAETHGVSTGTAPPTPLPHSATSETFRTARGAPMGFADALADLGSGPAESDPAEPVPAEPAPPTLDELEQRLHAACVEVEEWRRTPCIAEFLATTKGPAPPTEASGSSAASVMSSASARLPASTGLLPTEARGRQRALSAGNGAPSRLLQVEREVEALRARARKPSSRHEPQRPAPAHHHAGLHPAGRELAAHPPTLRLIDTTANSSSSGNANGSGGGGRPPAHRTFVDDVRIVGWATRGRGLDVHTEFKVVLHLAAGDNLTIMRRYTDFEVLRDVLCDRYPTFARRIPHLPRKKAFGKFEDAFLKRRESGLQFFLAYVMLHPVIGCSIFVRQWIQGQPS